MKFEVSDPTRKRIERAPGIYYVMYTYTIKGESDFSLRDLFGFTGYSKKNIETVSIELRPAGLSGEIIEIIGLNGRGNARLDGTVLPNYKLLRVFDNGIGKGDLDKFASSIKGSE